MNGISPERARLLEAHAIRWEFGLNDPTAIGWLTVAAYGAAAVLAWRAAARAREQNWTFERNFWFGICAAMVLLGINKQLDLHVLVTDIGRVWAIENGWYRQRRAFQKAVMLAGGAVAAIVLASGFLAARSRHRTIAWALAGSVATAGYILVRAASFHHADVFLRTTVFGLRWNWAVEVVGVALTAFAAWTFSRKIGRGSLRR